MITLIKKHTCCNEHKRERNISFNGTVQFDPTKTLTLRSKFVRDMNRRFAKLKQAIRKVIIEDDILGAKGTAIDKLFTNAPFEYKKSADKLKSFNIWLKAQNEKFIMSKGGEGISVIQIPGTVRGIESQWTDTYIQSAYQRGMHRGRAELIKAGVDLPDLDDSISGGLNTLFNQPFHIDRVGLIYTRTYEGLRGITEAMSNSISYELAQGMAEGRSPLEIAKSLTRRVDKIGLTRAKTLARTEVIRAHHDANIAEYKRAGIDGVRLKAEWVTAGFGNVCPICRFNEDQIFTIQEIEGMIPIHPSCRCVATPVVESDEEFRESSDRIAIGIKKGKVKTKKL